MNHWIEECEIFYEERHSGMPKKTCYLTTNTAKGAELPYHENISELFVLVAVKKSVKLLVTFRKVK
jgi:hypothetical protein